MSRLRPFAPLLTLTFAPLAERYIARNARRYRARARPLSIRELDALSRFFPHQLTSRVRISAADPPLQPPRAQGFAQWLGYPRLLDPGTTAAITFHQVIVHLQSMSMRTLFHELVHAEQYRQLGVKEFAKRYVRGFLTTGVYEEIPLEKQAYELEARFAANPALFFSVKDEVRRWIDEGRY